MQYRHEREQAGGYASTSALMWAEWVKHHVVGTRSEQSSHDESSQAVGTESTIFNRNEDTCPSVMAGISHD